MDEAQTAETRRVVQVQQLMYRPEAAALLLDISRSRLFTKLASGEIESVLIGRSRRIPHDALVKYVTQLRADQANGVAC